MPSITACGLKRRMSRSLQVPGSDSSELHKIYFCPGALRGMNDHFRPVGKPAPPRPRSELFFSSSTIEAGSGFSARIFFHAS
jgi:hypothetical protein